MSAALSRLRAALAWVLDFLADPDGSSSMARLVALGCAITGCVVALRFPAEWQTVGALIGGGAVAIINRQKGGDA